MCSIRVLDLLHAAGHPALLSIIALEIPKGFKKACVLPP